jgi:hypothetical protein
MLLSTPEIVLTNPGARREKEEVGQGRAIRIGIVNAIIPTFLIPFLLD